MTDTLTVQLRCAEGSPGVRCDLRLNFQLRKQNPNETAHGRAHRVGHARGTPPLPWTIGRRRRHTRSWGAWLGESSGLGRNLTALHNSQPGSLAAWQPGSLGARSLSIAAHIKALRLRYCECEAHGIPHAPVCGLGLTGASTSNRDCIIADRQPRCQQCCPTRCPLFEWCSDCP
jgi:hypothetical protein